MPGSPERSTVATAERLESTWQRAYATRLLATDSAAVVASVFAAQLLWIEPGATVQFGEPALSGARVTYTGISVAIIALWLGALAFYATRDQKNIGSGSIEYRRIVDATIRLFGVLALAAFLSRIELGRGYFLTALPIGLALLLGTRWLWRQWLHRQQRRGDYLSRALLVGQHDKTRHVVDSIRRDGSTGLLPVAALTRDGQDSEDLSIPVAGEYADLTQVIDAHNIDVVILTGADDLAPKHMRQLGWDLEARNVYLIVAPALTDVAGPRIHARPVAGLPLIHVDFPQFEGRKLTTKRVFDVIGSLSLLLVLSPLLVGVAMAVKFSSPGPIFYRQTRIGLRGTPFGMFKFRSMVQGADDQLASLLDEQGRSDTPLFKVTNDPRITPVGKFIRKYSLDELPQLLNVLLGDMSLVGPRPQREAEVALYDNAAHRRLFMKPGMSGLWQVSGRSSLSWEDSIRIDLYYVENWSLTADFIILWKTFRAVLTPGADAH